MGVATLSLEKARLRGIQIVNVLAEQATSTSTLSFRHKIEPQDDSKT